MQIRTQFLTNVVCVLIGEDRVVRQGHDNGVAIIFILDPWNLFITPRTVNTGLSSNLSLWQRHKNIYGGFIHSSATRNTCTHHLCHKKKTSWSTFFCLHATIFRVCTNNKQIKSKQLRFNTKVVSRKNISQYPHWNPLLPRTGIFKATLVKTRSIKEWAMFLLFTPLCTNLRQCCTCKPQEISLSDKPHHYGFWCKHSWPISVRFYTLCRLVCLSVPNKVSYSK